MKIVIDLIGYAVTLICLISQQLPKRKQILMCLAVVNLLTGVNVLLTCGLCSAVLLNIVGALQASVNLFRCIRKTDTKQTEIILFTVLYAVCGLAGYRRLLDLIPLFGTTMFMCAIFQKKEQNMRIFSLVNVIVYFIYYCIIGSSVKYSTLVSAASISIALYRYGKKQCISQ
ncbi:MAG: YgjV family protein [Clostridia bacterium]|nr:YgjV family protein [Clostridia bacterium]